MLEEEERKLLGMGGAASPEVDDIERKFSNSGGVITTKGGAQVRCHGCAALAWQSRAVSSSHRPHSKGLHSKARGRWGRKPARRSAQSDLEPRSCKRWTHTADA